MGFGLVEPGGEHSRVREASIDLLAAYVGYRSCYSTEKVLGCVGHSARRNSLLLIVASYLDLLVLTSLFRPDRCIAKRVKLLVAAYQLTTKRRLTNPKLT